MPGKKFITNRHQWAVKGPEFWPAHWALMETINADSGVFSSDAMIVWARNLGFLDDDAFVAAWNKHAVEYWERGILWRTAVLVWAARMALRVQGDFAEFGCYAGTTARILLDVVPIPGRQFWLYDLFEKPDEAHLMPDHGAALYDRVVARFPEKNVRVIRGLIPQSFDQGLPTKVALAHIDLNNAAPETATLNAIERRLSPGSIIVLDDYGQLPYVDQHLAHRAWFAKRKKPILEIPTGQGIVIW